VSAPMNRSSCLRPFGGQIPPQPRSTLRRAPPHRARAPARRPCRELGRGSCTRGAVFCSACEPALVISAPRQLSQRRPKWELPSLEASERAFRPQSTQDQTHDERETDALCKTRRSTTQANPPTVSTHRKPGERRASAPLLRNLKMK
jgi:hypothetical protein